MSEDFKGLNAVVTGAGSGIGLAVAAMLKAQGAHVFGLDLNEGSMSSVATFVKCDVGNDEGVSAAFKEIAQSVITLAEAEDLPAHGEAMSARFEDGSK